MPIISTEYKNYLQSANFINKLNTYKNFYLACIYTDNVYISSRISCIFQYTVCQAYCKLIMSLSMTLLFHSRDLKVIVLLSWDKKVR